MFNKADENGGGYYSPYDALNMDNTEVVAYINMIRAEERRNQIGEGNIWGGYDNYYWGLY